jgi:hypothetical protein
MQVVFKFYASTINLQKTSKSAATLKKPADRQTNHVILRQAHFLGSLFQGLPFFGRYGCYMFFWHFCFASFVNGLRKYFIFWGKAY